ncbi:MAG: hypothetical protein AAF560_00335 [Acidobacteriota bacterium]
MSEPGPRISRRAAVGGTVGLLGLAAAARYLPELLLGPGRAERLIVRLVELVAVPDPVAVGGTFFASHPGTTADELVVEVLAELPMGGTLAELQAAFRRRAMEDFERGRTERLDGWVLARSEASLCGLVALVAGQKSR